MSGRIMFRSCCAAVALLLTASLVTVVSPGWVPVTIAAGSSDEAPELQRPDAVSAMITARAVGRRVEDLSQRSETQLVFANPDGTWTSEQDAEPTRAKDEDGVWRDVDTTLVERNGSLEPKNAASDVRFSAGGDKVFAELTDGGKDLAWKWPTVLPEPQIDGDTATYVDAVDGGDLVVTATSTGFTHSIVLRERPTTVDSTEQLSGNLTEEPAVGMTGDPTVDPVQFSMPIVTDGAKLSETAAGEVQVKTSAGEVVASAPKPLMWDSSTDHDGDPDNVVPVDTTITPAGGTTPQGDAAGANPVLTLTPDRDFLSDPDTEYPVTIDPTFTTYVSGDTWLESNSYTSSQAASQDLKVGTYDSGTHVARSYLTFSSSPFAGKHVTKAQLWMRNYQSLDCSGGDVLVNRIIESWSVTGVTWATRPNFTSTGQASFSTPYGGPTCPANGAHWDITSIVDGWASGAFTNYGLQVKANTESWNGSRRIYRSTNYPDTPVTPRMIVTYNQAPYSPTAPLPTAVGTYAPNSSTPVTTYVQDAKPTFTATVTDPDRGNVGAVFQVYNAATNAAVSYCYAPAVASGSKASCTVGAALADGTNYYVQTTGWDGYDYTGNSRYIGGAKWSGKTHFTVASAPLTVAPMVSCPTPYSNGSWSTSTPPPNSTVTCTVSATGSGPSAPGFIEYSIDGRAPVTERIPQSTSAATAKVDVTIPTNDGGHGVRAIAISPSGRRSPANDYGFGWGNVGLSKPMADQVETTTDTLELEASGPKSGDGTTSVTASVKWRVAGSGKAWDQGWNEDTSTSLTAVNNAVSGVHVTGTWDTRHAVSDTSSGTGAITLDPDRPVLLDVQVCIDYPGDQLPEHCSWAQGGRQVLRVAHAFGGNFPTADVPGGQVALWTGELAIAAEDATIAAPGAALRISRTASSFAGPVANPANQVFGPGWNASLDGPGVGLGEMTLIDNTLIDGTLQLLDGVGTTMVFGKTTAPVRRTSADLQSDGWAALNEDAQLSGITLKVSGSGSTTLVGVTEDDGTTTTFAAHSAGTPSTAGVYTIASIDEAGAEGATTYSRDSQGRITRMLAPVPEGVSCEATFYPGCRAVTITYAASTTATTGAPGDVAGQVQKIEQTVGLAGGGSTSTPLATFAYDAGHRLVSSTDPRTSLSTRYSYDSTSDRVASITPPGQKPINYLYAGSSHKLARVTRERPATDPAGGTANLATIVYDIPTSGHTGLPNLSTSAVAGWEQASAPTYGAAVFGPEQTFATAGTTVSVADVDTVGTSTWRDADLSYTDADGRTTNTAAYGAGRWLFTAATYDDQNNVTRSLSAADIAAIQAGDLLASQAGDLTVYHPEVKDSAGKILLAAGSIVTDTYATARWIRDASGVMVWARPHTNTVYDQGAPNDGVNPATYQRYARPTTVTSDAVDPATRDTVDTYAVATTDYSTAIAGDIDAGWSMALAGTETTKMAGSAGSTTTDIVTQTRYDATGRVIETRQPKSTGSDAGTRKTYYYTAGAHPNVTACGSKPGWAGVMCQTTYAGTASGADLVTTTISSYDDLLNPLTTTETANSATRTTTNTYKNDGKPYETTIAITGLSGSTAVGKTTQTYDTATGLPTSSATAAAGGNTGGTVTIGYDTWGRQISYSPVSGDTTTTDYNADGDVSLVTTKQGSTTIGTTSYTYDGTDAAGKEEHRGQTTQVSISRPSGGALVFTGAYDAAGALVRQNLPSGLIQRTTYDPAGEPTSLSYSGPVAITDPDTGDVTGTDPDAPWIGWSQDNDAAGRVRREWTPSGAAMTADLTGAAATGFARDYTYDRAARLVTVKDQTLPAGAGTVTADDAGTAISGTVCQVRNYAFDANGNRTSKTSITGATSASCPTSGGTTKTWTYDNGDRLTGSYIYDAFGRQTTIPQIDTPAAAAGGTPGNATLAYYDTDAIQSITQNGATTTYKLDPSGRRSDSTTGTTTISRHYADGSDNPDWTSTVTGGGAAVTERYAEDLGGNLGLTITGSTASLALSDLHGDNVTNVDLPTSGAPTGIGSWIDSDEYGNPIVTANTGKTPTNPTGVTGGLGYGWLGGKQRAADGSGMLLMGSRVYNPATGSFVSTDPIFGGTSTAYAYPQDPIGLFDLDGRNTQPGGGGGGGGGLPRSGMFGIGKAKGWPKGVKGRIYGKVNVKEIHEALKRGKSKSSYNKVVGSLKDLEYVWRQMTRGGLPLGGNGPFTRIVLKDGWQIRWRRESLSGGDTIELWRENERIRKVHIQKGVEY